MLFINGTNFVKIATVIFKLNNNNNTFIFYNNITR